MLGLTAPESSGLDVESSPPLLVSKLPELREPADPSAAPVRAVAPIVFNGRIDPPGDEDRFVLAVSSGQRLHIAVEASQCGSALDGVVQVLGTKGSVIASADDTTITVPGQPAAQGTIVIPDPSLDITVPAGTSELTLVLRDLEERGGVGFPYRIVATPVVPTFDLNVNDAEVSIPRGGSAGVGVTVVRKDYSGPIVLTVADPPSGVTVRQGTIAAGQTVGALSISAAPTANFVPTALRLVGRGQGPEGPIEVEATRKLVFAQQAALPTNAILQRGLFAAPAVAQPVAFETPGAPIEIAHGLSAQIPVKLVRSKGADAALAITSLPLPPGVAVPRTAIAEKAVQGSLPVSTTLAAALGSMTIGVQAKGKFPGGEQTIALPAVTITIVHPADIVLDSPAIEVKPGRTAEVKGRVQRRGAFTDPVTVRMSSLPAGLKADPVTVAAGATEFALKLVADAKAATSAVAAQVVPVFQVNKKDYPAAPVRLAVKVFPAK
jgi:hypothetical protein